MKKITAIVVSLIYVTAIVVVAFMGVLAEIRNQTVDVANIVLTEARYLTPGYVLTYPTGTKVLDSDYAIFSRPTQEGEGQTEVDIAWNIGGLSYDYVIQIRGYKTIMEYSGWKDGTGNLSLSAFVLPENATKQELLYNVYDENGGTLPDISISDAGLLHFEEKRGGVFSFLVRISATDNSYKVCNIHVIAVGY